MEFLKVSDKTKIVTDPVVLAALVGWGIDKDGVELFHDYAPRSKGKGYSPYGKLYRDLNSQKQFIVVSGLPMVDAYGQRHELEWRDKNGVIESGNNIFHAVVKDDIRLIALSDQPAFKKDSEAIFHPQLFIDGSETISSAPRLLETDPVNENYHNNVLEWDYGVCKRRVRLIEGRFLGSWVFPVNPCGTVRIKYNQSGDYRLSLGEFRVSDDEEYIPSSFFDNPLFGYPVTISDSVTYYPDADPESSSVDGQVRRASVTESWAEIESGTGTLAYDSVSGDGMAFVDIGSRAITDKWQLLIRSFTLFGVSLPEGSSITGATLSIHGNGVKTNTFSPELPITVNVFSSNPAGNTELVTADFTAVGSTPFSDSIAYADWDTGDYNDFELNESGLSAIPTSGIAKFGFREATYDAGASTPGWQSDKFAWVGGNYAEKGAGYKPKLVITFAPAAEEKTSADSGSGIETISLRTQESGDQGAGSEVGLADASLYVNDAGTGNENGYLAGGTGEYRTAGDEGSGKDAIKMLARKAGSDLRLHSHHGRLGMPNKEVSL